MFRWKSKEEDNIQNQCKQYIKNYIFNQENKKKLVVRDYEKYLVFMRLFESRQNNNDKYFDNFKEIQKEIFSFYQGNNYREKLPSEQNSKKLDTEEDTFLSFIDKKIKENDNKDYKFEIRSKNNTNSKFYQEMYTPKSYLFFK